MKKFVICLTIMTLTIFGVLLTLDFYDITQYISLSYNYDWLGFAGGFLGSVIGGIITFLGVYLTLKFQKNTDDEKNRLSIMPIFEYKLSYNKEDFDNSEGQVAGKVIPHINVEGATGDDGRYEEWYLHLIAENVGMGHAQIISIELNFKENGTDKIICSQKIGYFYKLVKMNDKKSLMFMIYAPKERFYKDGYPTQEFLYPLDIIVEYQDLIGNKYQQKLKSCIAKSVVYVEEQVVSSWNVADLHYYENFEYISDKEKFKIE